MSVELQSILYHYDVSYAAACVLVNFDFVKVKVCRRANPEGDDDQRRLFAKVAEQLNPLQRVLVRDAFVRICNKDPLAAVVAPPPNKKQARSDHSSKSSKSKKSESPAPGVSGTPPVASVAAPAPVAAPAAADAAAGEKASSASTAAKKDDDGLEDIDSASDSPADSADDDSANDDDGADTAKSSAGSSTRRDLGSLFDDVSNQVLQRLWVRVPSGPDVFCIQRLLVRAPSGPVMIGLDAKPVFAAHQEAAQEVADAVPGAHARRRQRLLCLAFGEPLSLD